jgi:hypothetical protein
MSMIKEFKEFEKYKGFKEHRLLPLGEIHTLNRSFGLLSRSVRQG